jgi:hypothetical protein
MKITASLVLAGILAASEMVAGRQQPRDAALLASATGTGAIAGTLVTAEQPETPIRRAAVVLSFSDATFIAREVITTDTGGFAFTDLPAGRYRLAASKAAYVDMAYGAKRPNGWNGGTSIALAEGQRLTNLTFRMPRGAVITGRVIDLNGQPAARAHVRVLRSSVDWRTGLREFLGWDDTETDDRGIYRVYGLPPGDFVVSATTTDDQADFRVPSSAEWRWVDAQLKGPTGAPSTPEPPVASRTMAYAPVFFPGTPDQASAGVLTLTTAEERAGIDIPLALVPTAKVEGEIHAPDGIAPAGVTIRLYRAAESGAGAVAAGNTTSDTAGRFVFRGIPPGAYVVVTRGRSTGAPNSAPTVTWAMRDITVAGQDQRVALDLQPGLPIGGQVTFDGATLKPPPDLSTVRVTLLPASGSRLGVGHSAEPRVNRGR